ncbi:MAG: hypothetical protein NZ920_01245 [Aigarchaeota archaeon]|nr:hypothetical protein [Aigarchaeota archaeon]MDW8093066.1 hypothetical protein [Nitrososphaerota archaeon]
MILFSKLGERYGRRPSDFLKGHLGDLLFDLLSTTVAAREEIASMKRNRGRRPR